jgi:hypothetical protein
VARKSPIHHAVKPHIRNGVHVHRYERGEGKAPRQVIGAASKRGGGYTVTFIGDRTESFSVQAGSYVGALDSGLERVTGSPIAVRLRRR